MIWSRHALVPKLCNGLRAGRLQRKLLRLFAQEVICIGEQLRYAIGCQSVVITADSSATIDQDKAGAMDWTALRRLPIREAKLKAIT